MRRTRREGGAHESGSGSDAADVGREEMKSAAVTRRVSDGCRMSRGGERCPRAVVPRRNTVLPEAADEAKDVMESISATRGSRCAREELRPVGGRRRAAGAVDCEKGVGGLGASHCSCAWRYVGSMNRGTAAAAASGGLASAAAGGFAGDGSRLRGDAGCASPAVHGSADTRFTVWKATRERALESRPKAAARIGYWSVCRVVEHILSRPVVPHRRNFALE